MRGQDGRKRPMFNDLLLPGNVITSVQQRRDAQTTLNSNHVWF